MKIEMHDMPDEGTNGETWLKVMANEIWDWPSIVPHLTARQQAALGRAAGRPKLRLHMATTEELAEHGYEFEMWWRLEMAGAGDPLISDDLAEDWWCEQCPAQVDATVHYQDDGPAGRMCLECLSQVLRLEETADYAGPLVSQFFVHPTVILDDAPTGAWVRDGSSFRFKQESAV